MSNYFFSRWPVSLSLKNYSINQLFISNKLSDIKMGSKKLNLAQKIASFMFYYSEWGWKVFIFFLLLSLIVTTRKSRQLSYFWTILESLVPGFFKYNKKNTQNFKNSAWYLNLYLRFHITLIIYSSFSWISVYSSKLC